MPSIPNTPLAQLSDTNARINKCLPQSPSLPMLPSEKSTAIQPSPENVPSTPISSPHRTYARHAHRNSDVFVKSRIEIFEKGMADTQIPSPMGPPSPIRQPIIPPRAQGLESHAALQRAVVGREEAEAALADTLGKLQGAQVRERKMAERIETLMEEFASAKKHHEYEHDVYVMEVNGLRSMAHKAESRLIASRGENNSLEKKLLQTRDRVDRERSEKEAERQKAINAECDLAKTEEKLAETKTKLEALEKAEEQRKVEAALMAKAKLVHMLPEKKTLPMTNTATQTEIVLEPSNEDRRPTLTHSYTQPLRPASSQSDRMHKDRDLATDEIVSELRKQLAWMKELKSRDDDLIEFMQLECQFKACPCRTAPEVGNEQKRHQEPVSRAQEEEDENSVFGAHGPGEIITNSLKATPALAVAEPAVVSGSTEVSARHAPHENSTPVPEDVPLPNSPANRFTPEPTALLEDMTQVMVEPAMTGDAKTFSFSTSMSGLPVQQQLTATGMKLKVATGPKFRPFNSQTSASDAEDDLFNLSPPKRIPPRPSTALGLSSATKQNRAQQLQHSPIRVVPNSPQSPVRTVKIPGSRPKSAMGSRTPKSGTRQAQLRVQETGSPSKNPSKSTAKSPIAAPTSISRSAVFESSVSPSVLPPATPIFRSTGGQAVAETTTTTMIPLRGMEGDDVFSPISSNLPRTPASSKLSRAETMPLPQELVDGLDEQNSTAADNVPLALQVPGTPVSRAEALRQIRERRDRARSVNMGVGSRERSKSHGREPKGAPSSAKRGLHPSAVGGLLERGREVSQASAPGRM